MGNEETKQSEQGQVSTRPGARPKDVTQNNFTEDEKALAEKCQVSPEAVRQITEIVCKDTKGVQQLIDLVRDRQEQQAETQEQEQPTELDIDEQTQERLKSYYKNLDPKTKLAILTLSEIQCLDGINFQISKKEGKLYDQILDDFESVCLETYHSEPDDIIEVAIGVINKEDIWLCGVWEAVRMVTQNT